MSYKVIITGANGLVSEGVLLECLENVSIEQVLLVSRWPNPAKHPKLEELIIPDFLSLDDYDKELTGYDACFYCTEVTSVYLEEAIYNHITFDVTLNFAVKLLLLNPDIIFNFLSNSEADTTEAGELMWARVTGKTENALNKLIFKKAYYFRTDIIRPLKKQKNVTFYHKMIDYLYPLLRLIMPHRVITMKEIGAAMINAMHIGDCTKRTLQIKDIRALSQQRSA